MSNWNVTKLLFLLIWIFRLTIFAVFHIWVVRQTCVKVRHQWADILRRCKPTVNVITGVQKPASRDGDIGDWMPIEGKLKRQLHRHRASMWLRQKLVDGEILAVGVNTFAMKSGKILVLHDSAVVVLMMIFIDGRYVVFNERLIILLVGYVKFRPINFRAIFAAVGDICRPIWCWNANFRCQRWRDFRGCCRRQRTHWRWRNCCDGEICYRLVHTRGVERCCYLFVNRWLACD